MSSKDLKDLHELLTELFKPSEFERFLHFGPEGDTLVRALNFQQEPAHVFYEGAKLLERHGLVNRALFGRLADERPGKRERIEAVERSILGKFAASVGTHVITLEAPIGGNPSLISSSEFRDALGGCADLERLRLDLNDLDVHAGPQEIWTIGQQRIQAGVRTFLRDTIASSEERHISVFGLAPIPWLMALGYALSETVPSRLFTRLRAPASWSWEAERTERDRWSWHRSGARCAARDAVILISASAVVRPALVAEVLPGKVPTYALALTHPRLDAVRCEVQIEEFGQVYREVLEAIEQEVEGVERIHVFAAAPVAVAVDCGRRILHSAAPTLVAYHLHKGAYVRALELGG